MAQRDTAIVFRGVHQGAGPGGGVGRVQGWGGEGRVQGKWGERLGGGSGGARSVFRVVLRGRVWRIDPVTDITLHCMVEGPVQSASNGADVKDGSRGSQSLPHQDKQIHPLFPEYCKTRSLTFPALRNFFVSKLR